MILSEVLKSDAILLDLPGTGKEDLIRVMVERLAEIGLVASVSQVTQALLARERVMSTGVGQGIALPHARNAAVKETCVALARLSAPMEFAALDGRPVDLVFLAADPGDRGELMRVLAQISRLMRSGDLRKRLMHAKTPADAARQISLEEARLKD